MKRYIKYVIFAVVYCLVSHFIYILFPTQVKAYTTLDGQTFPDFPSNSNFTLVERINNQGYALLYFNSNSNLYINNSLYTDNGYITVYDLTNNSWVLRQNTSITNFSFKTIICSTFPIYSNSSLNTIMYPQDYNITLDTSKWISIYNFTLPESVDIEQNNIVIAYSSNYGYRLLVQPKGNYKFGLGSTSFTFPYLNNNNLISVNSSGNFYNIDYYDDVEDNSLVFKNTKTGTGASFTGFDYIVYSNTDIYSQIYSNTFYFNVLTAPPDNYIPPYLNGYKKVDLTTSDRYVMISGVSSGSVYILAEDFLNYGGRLSYYDNDLNTQLYTSYIQDYEKTSDGLFVRQDFNLDNYYGADWVMFSKYLYLEGEDNISYSIWVPDDSYDSQVTITPNDNGGNDFDFEYKDSNGDIQSGQANSVDLSQPNPLLGNIFQDFSSNTFGLTSIVTAPLGLISSLASSSCSSLSVPLPYINENLTLPCMTSIYSTHFGGFFTLYQTITSGIIGYWVIVKIFNLIKDFKNPDHDEIEVLDL